VPDVLPIGSGIGVIEGFEPQMLDYLNSGGSADGLRTSLGGLAITDDDGTIWQARAQVVPIDVTGNTTPDVVVGLAFFVEGQYADGALFVFGCREGQYEGGAVTAFGGQVFSGGGPDPGIRAVQDMNGNGVPEIVFSYIDAIGTHANFTRLFRIIEWNEGEFVDLVQSESYPPNAAAVTNGDGAVRDTNGNKNLELVLSNGLGQYYEDGGPQRSRTDTWAWDGYTFRLSHSEHEPPIYRFQAIQDGDEASRLGRYDSALTFYEQAISSEELLGWSQDQLWPDSAYGSAPTPTPEPEERSRLSAYAHYRTMLVHVLQDAPLDAQSAYEALQQQFPAGAPGHQYVELATVFWKAHVTSGDISTACGRAAEHATAHADELLAPLGSSFYGYFNKDYTAEDVCPFGEQESAHGL
jgi:hypothetical protein